MNTKSKGRLATFRLYLQHATRRSTPFELDTSRTLYFDAVRGGGRWGGDPFPPGWIAERIEALVAEGEEYGKFGNWHWSAHEVVFVPGPDHATLVRDRLAAMVEADPRKQREIAEAAGMSPAHFNQVLGGHRLNPSIETVGAILAALGKRWADLDPA